jgi:hypothetical protein
LRNGGSKSLLERSEINLMITAAKESDLKYFSRPNGA